MLNSLVYHAKTTAFVVEHDFVIATYLADRVIVFEGQPSLETIANAPQDFLPGVNRFLGSLDITFRRDPISHRPIVNKENSVEVKHFLVPFVQNMTVMLFLLRIWSRNDREISFSWKIRTRKEDIRSLKRHFCDLYRKRPCWLDVKKFSNG